MTPDPEDNAAESTPKPRARRKKALEIVETGTQAPEEAQAGPARKIRVQKIRARKPAAPETKAAEAEMIQAAEKPAAKKRAKKAAKAAVEEPVPEPVAEAAAKTGAAGEAPAAAGDEGHSGGDIQTTEPGGEEPRLERLQKILAHAGIASRRAAEEMILAGRVQINGKVVTELGTRADLARDHIRVDGKLLHGPERLRYFALNKPKGYVTTVSDPEGRPTVMQFFAGERERLYPVGRLDYLSEGLLLVTNDGELANKLTKASSGVEKTYLVKVAGQPQEEDLDALRAGVVIERGRHGSGSGRVRTAPAQIRQVREGDNPWYEVIVIEGRNRELRKMFEEIGHHVEKIRRVGYGPLTLDLEPGKVRELDPEEVQSLRLAAEGKLKTRRRRGPAPAQLPTVAGKTVRYKKADGRPGFEPRPARELKPESGTGFRAGGRPAFKAGFKAGFKSGGKPEFTGRGSFGSRPGRAKPPVTDFVLPPRKAAPPEAELDGRPPRQRQDFNPEYKPGFRTGGKPAFRSEGRPGTRPGAGPGSTPGFRKDRPAKSFGAGAPEPRGTDFRGAGKPFGRSGSGSRPAGPRPTGPRLAGSQREDRPFRPAGGSFDRRPDDRRPQKTRGRDFERGYERPPAKQEDDFAPRRPSRIRVEPVEGRENRPSRPSGPGEGRPFRPASGGRPFRPRMDGPPARPAGRFSKGRFSESEERPREFRPRGTGGPAKKFAGSRPPRPEFRSEPGRATRSGPVRSGPVRSGPGRPASGAGSGFRPKNEGEAGGPPRKKERWRDSYTGKNKGRPKPKPKRAPGRGE